jgi:DNA-binding LytR/AlgR family response regulator
MYSVYIIDDEATAIDILSRYVEQIPHLKLVGSSTDSIEALMNIQQNAIDLIFLDIHMPKLSGIDFLKVINGKCKVIITTAYPQNALDGFDLGVIDYLLKPISFERFAKAISKIQINSSIEEAPKTDASKPKEDNFMFVKADTKGKFVKVNFEEIIFVEGLKNYISIYTDNDRIITLLSIKEMEEKLQDKGFLRVHKSYIVALNRIKAVDGNQIILKDKKYVPLGDTYRNEFFKILDQMMMESQRK